MMKGQQQVNNVIIVYTDKCIGQHGIVKQFNGKFGQTNIISYYHWIK